MDAKVNLKKTLDCYRATRGQFRLVEVPPLQYLVVDGHGDPNSAVFAAAVEALYPVAYALKFASKRDLGRDYVVPPLEGLWWADDLASFTTRRDKGTWDWTLLILTPDWVGAEMFATAVAQVAAKRAPARLPDVRLETLVEGRCVQTLHIGSFDSEAPVLHRLHEEVIPGQGLRMTGRHHEIYLSDMRRVAEDSRRTILRQPVAAADAMLMW